MSGDAPVTLLRLLVVDDEPFILREIARGLSRKWGPVLTAQSAAEAASLIGAHPQIGVMVTDIRMPGEDGINLAGRMFDARAEAQALEVVLISGHAMPCDVAQMPQGGHAEFVQKPFRLAELDEAVSRAHARAVERRSHAAACERP